MSRSSFRGGIHPHNTGKKPTRDLPITEFIPDSVCIPMSMHIGTPSAPCVKKGDRVLLGQVIGEPVGGLGLPVHASVSGTVTSIENKMLIGANQVTCVVIENDHLDEWCELSPVGDVETARCEDILTAIKLAGVCGMGGASFPTHVKLNVPEGKKCDIVIVNGAECETFLTADDRLMREMPDRIVKGVRAAMRVAEVEKAVIAIEDNKPEAIATMKKAVEKYPGISIHTLRTKYPMGGEKQLVRTITGKEIPDNRLPIDVGAVVINVATASAICDAVTEGKPLVSRITTVTGDVKEPKNFLVRIGTKASDLIEACKGPSSPVGKIVSGGGMTGFAMSGDHIPIMKANGGIVVYSEKKSMTPPESACIRCARCVEACPMGLNPYILKPLCDSDQLGKAVENDLMKCILCGCCSYVCPANRHLTSSFKDGKDRFVLRKKKEAQV